jgi:hypothetical protein
MTLDDFLQACTHTTPPASLMNNIYLLSLWYDHKGNWDKSHELIQDLNDNTASAIHAYLHRKEGDSWNADYWYRKAGTTRKNISLDTEWRELAQHLTD